MRRTFALQVFGCQMNIHDAERVSGILESRGWREVQKPEEADAVIFLTCCVRESAENRLYGRLSSLKPLKEGPRSPLFAVGGCVAQKDGERLLRRFPHVDLVFGTRQYPRIDALLEEARKGRICRVDMEELSPDPLSYSPRDPHRAWITISHGCDNFCSYCIVPLVRGREVSRPRDEIIREAEELVARGAREINLLGQNVNSYRRREEGPGAFARLLRELAGRFPDTWIRFTTSHPRDLDEETIAAVRDLPQVCEHVHLPLQAGSNRILKAMNRGYTVEEYMEKVSVLRREIPGVSITTDLIVGYPGEREEDFLATLEAVRRCRFDASFTFIYSPREGTAASKLPDDVPPEVKRKRLERLAALTGRLTVESLQKEVGKELPAMVRGASRKDPDVLEARTRNNKIVHFTGRLPDLRGRFVRVKITEAGRWSLRGEPVEVLEEEAACSRPPL